MALRHPGLDTTLYPPPLPGPSSTFHLKLQSSSHVSSVSPTFVKAASSTSGAHLDPKTNKLDTYLFIYVGKGRPHT